MGAIRIKVGASLEANALTVFQPLEKAAERARKNIQASLNAGLAAGARGARAGGGGGGGGVKPNVDALDRELDKMANKILRDRERAERAATRIATKEAKAREKVKADEAKAAAKSSSDQTKAAEKAQREETSSAAREAKARAKAEVEAAREIARAQRAGALEARRAEREAGGGRARPRPTSDRGGAIGIGRRAGMRVSRATAAVYGLGGAAASSMMAGLGIDTDVGAMIQKGVSNDALAQKIVNSAPEYTKASVVERQAAAGGIAAQVQSVARSTATDTTEAMEGLEKFTALTGDLKTGRDVLGGLAKLSRATGSSLADMASAAAEVSNNLGDVPEKGALVEATMRAIAGQGKMGAVEIKDLARQMAKVASVAGAFEGDRGKNIAILGAMAQETKLRGGAASATQATTSVQSFVANLTKGATLKHWTSAGLNPYADAGKTKLRSPEELILEALKKTKGNLPELAKLFPSSQAMRAVKGFASVYSEKGGGKAGLDAVHEEFANLTRAAMSVEEVDKAFAAQMSTTQSQVQVFSNAIAETAQGLARELTPAVLALAPAVLSIAAEMTELFVGTAAKLQTAINTELDAIGHRGSVRRSVHEEGVVDDKGKAVFETDPVTGKPKLDPKTHQPIQKKRLVIAKSGVELLENDAKKLGDQQTSVEQMVERDKKKAKGFGDHWSEAKGFWGKVGAFGGLANDALGAVSGQTDAAREKLAQDQKELASVKDNTGKTNALLQEIRDALKSGALSYAGSPSNPSAPSGGVEDAETPE